jgi:NADH-quinone oxidoreductase subunit L
MFRSICWPILSLLMVLIVTGVGFLIHIYATDYMIHMMSMATPIRPRFPLLTFLNLFIASMLVLVLGDNYLMMCRLGIGRPVLLPASAAGMTEG